MSFHNPNKDLNESSRFLYEELLKKPGGSQIEIKKIKELYSEDDNFWDSVKQTFISDFRVFDNIILKIHYRRDRVISDEKRFHILKFLTLGYLLSNDLRYYNEFLYFCDQKNDSLRQVNLIHFLKNLDSDGCHIFPLESRRSVNEYIDSNFNSDPEVGKADASLRISLLGSPFAYKNLYNNLIEQNYKVENFYFTYDQKGFKSSLKNNALVKYLYFYYKNVRHKYRTLNNPPHDAYLTKILSAGKPNLALHQLGFIIKNNIIKAFELGILNDHLGCLPFVRGRSSLEYNILYGFPSGSTIHFIDEGVDTGQILWFYKTDYKANSIEHLKEYILATADRRLLNAVDYVNSRSFSLFENKGNKGLQHFVIHPELISYINRTFFS